MDLCSTIVTRYALCSGQQWFGAGYLMIYAPAAYVVTFAWLYSYGRYGIPNSINRKWCFSNMVIFVICSRNLSSLQICENYFLFLLSSFNVTFVMAMYIPQLSLKCYLVSDQNLYFLVLYNRN
jgi:hypothetical protein